MVADHPMRSFIARALEEVGPRPSCSAQERALGRLLETEWSRFCSEVRAEAFTCHPHAFLGFIPLSALLTAAAILLLGAQPWLAAGLAALSGTLIVCELLLYRELVDPLFPKREGSNIVGVIPPRGDTRRRVLLTAHQDSAFEFNIWYWFKSAGVLVNVLGLAAFLLPLVAGVLAGVGWISSSSPGLQWLGWALLPPVLVHVLFHSFRGVPGAMDDLAGLAVVTETGRRLAAESLEHTEVLLVACAAEECGLRGAKRFAARHRALLHELPAWDVNVDGVYDERFLSVVTRELSTGTRHTPELVSLCEQAAHDVGQRAKRVWVPFGGTDAAAFAAAGVGSVSLLCQDTSRLVANYHTRLDTLDRVRTESLDVMHGLVTQLVRRIDGGALDASASAGAGRRLRKSHRPTRSVA